MLLGGPILERPYLFFLALLGKETLIHLVFPSPLRKVLPAENSVHLWGSACLTSWFSALAAQLMCLGVTFQNIYL